MPVLANEPWLDQQSRAARQAREELLRRFKKYVYKDDPDKAERAMDAFVEMRSVMLDGEDDAPACESGTRTGKIATVR